MLASLLVVLAMLASSAVSASTSPMFDTPASNNAAASAFLAAENARAVFFNNGEKTLNV